MEPAQVDQGAADTPSPDTKAAGLQASLAIYLKDLVTDFNRLSSSPLRVHKQAVESVTPLGLPSLTVEAARL